MEFSNIIMGGKATLEPAYGSRVCPRKILPVEVVTVWHTIGCITVTLTNSSNLGNGRCHLLLCIKEKAFPTPYFMCKAPVKCLSRIHMSPCGMIVLYNKLFLPGIPVECSISTRMMRYDVNLGLLQKIKEVHFCSLIGSQLGITTFAPLLCIGPYGQKSDDFPLKYGKLE